MTEFTDVVNARTRTVDPDIFTNPEIFEAEQEKIFGKCWLFLGHESQLPEPGSFITAYMGTDPIIVWRGADGEIRAFLNSCSHRGMKLCREDEGRKKLFTCPYHGWSFNSAGDLIGRPNKDRYDDDFNPGEWGLIEVARVEKYAGMLFGNFDPDAESLEDYLGEIKWYFDTQFRRTKEGRVIYPGVQKWLININWKVAAEQLSGDNYHAPITHASAARLGLLGEASKFAKAAPFEQDFEVKTEKGHSWINLNPSVSPFAETELYEAYETDIRQEAKSLLTEKQADLSVTGAVGTVFPNFAFISFLGGIGLRVMQPRGPEQTEIWLWSAGDSEAPDWRHALSRHNNLRSFTAAGLLDADDAEMWLGVQETVRGYQRKKHSLNYQLGGHTARRENERPGLIDQTPSEVSIFGFYERWRNLMAAEAA